MTVIVANREMMCADHLAADGFADIDCDKIETIGEDIVGCAGYGTSILKFLRWYREKKPLGGKPPKMSTDNDYFEALVLTKDGLFHYCNCFLPEKLKPDAWAIGAGGQSAITSLKWGKTPIEAVVMACRVTPSTCRLDESGQPQVVLLKDAIAAAPKAKPAKKPRGL